MFHKLTKEQLLGLVAKYNLVNRLKAGYSSFTKPVLIKELRNHLTYNETKKEFETKTNSIQLKRMGPEAKIRKTIAKKNIENILHEKMGRILRKET